MGGDFRHTKMPSSIAVKRLALGTVQFGLRYGVANRRGQVSLADATAIVRLARSYGLDTLDTAASYGESEDRLGDIGVSEWRVVSKLPPLPELCGDARQWVWNGVLASLHRLKIPVLYGLLLHRPEDLMERRGAELYLTLQELKERGLVERIGVSVYDPGLLDRIGHQFRFDLVQAPFNVLDRRLYASGWLDRLKTLGVEVHARSAFLQGLLLMRPEERPPKFSRWASLWSVWDRWLRDARQGPIEACLGFSLRYPEIDRIVVGVDSIAQLLEVLAGAVPSALEPPDELSTQDSSLINPSHWSAL